MLNNVDLPIRSAKANSLKTKVGLVVFLLLIVTLSARTEVSAAVSKLIAASPTPTPKKVVSVTPTPTKTPTPAVKAATVTPTPKPTATPTPKPTATPTPKPAPVSTAVMADAYGNVSVSGRVSAFVGAFTSLAKTFVSDVLYFGKSTAYYINSLGNGRLHSLELTKDLDVKGAIHDSSNLSVEISDPLDFTGRVIYNPTGNISIDDDLEVKQSTRMFGPVYANTIEPLSATQYDLGSVTKEWGRLYANQANLSGNMTLAGDLAVNGNMTLGDAASDTTDVVGALTVGGGYGSTGVTISAAGVYQGNGALTADGLITGLAGLTITGGIASLNASSNFATNINTGTSTGAVTIGGTAGNTINIGTNNTTADTIAIGSALDTVSVTGAKWSAATTGAITSAPTTNVTSLTISPTVAQTTAIDATAANIVTALNVGANDIVGTTGLINYNNFDVDASGNVISAGNVAVNGGSLTTTAATGNLFNTGAATLNIGGAANVALNIGVGNTAYAGINIGTGTGGNAINIGNNDTTADTIALGSAKDSVTVRGATITIGNVADANVSITDNNWNVSTAGLANFVSVGAATAGTGTFTDLTSTGNTILGDAASDTIALNGQISTDATFSNAGNRTISVAQSSAGAGKTLTVAAGAAFGGSGGNGGNLILQPGAKDGGGTRGAVVPSGNGTDNLGATGTRWSSIFANTLDFITSLTGASGTPTVDFSTVTSATIGNGTATVGITGGAAWSVSTLGAGAFLSLTTGGGYASTGTTISSAGIIQTKGALTVDGLANLNGGIAVGTDDFTVNGTTGSMAVLSKATTGTLASVSLDAAAATGTLTGLSIDLSPVTGGAFAKKGISIVGDADGAATTGIVISGSVDYALDLGGATVSGADIRLKNNNTIDNSAVGTVTINATTLQTAANATIQPSATGTLAVKSNGASAMSVDTGAGAALSLGDTNATTVAIGTTAATTINIGNGGALTRAINIGTGTGKDTIAIGTGIGADAITIGEASGTTAIATSTWGVTALGAASFLSANIGSGTTITKHLSGTNATVVSASIPASACGAYGTITVTGAAVGDTVIVTPTAVALGIETLGLSWNGYVSATSTVTIRACNPTLAPIDALDTQSWRADVWEH